MTDKRGRVIRFTLQPGHVAESTEFASLLSDVPLTETRELLADKAYDSRAVRELLASKDIIATVPTRSHRVEAMPYDRQSYKGRHLIANAFRDAKQFRGIATRYCKRAATFEGLLHLVIWFLGTQEAQRGPSPYLA